MNLTKLSERSKLQRRIREEPDDVEARKTLALLFVEAGDLARAATELMSISRVHISRGEGLDARNACRQALKFDPANLELRLLLAQIHARFPASRDRAAAPIVEAIAEADLDGPVIELTATPRLEEVVDAPSGELPVVQVAPPTTTEEVELDALIDERLATKEGRLVADAASRVEDETADMKPLGDLVEVPTSARYRDEVTAPTGAAPELPDADSGNARTVIPHMGERAPHTTIGAAAVGADRAESDPSWSSATKRVTRPRDLSPIPTSKKRVFTPKRPRSKPPAESEPTSSLQSRGSKPLPDPFESVLGVQAASQESLPIAAGRVPTPAAGTADLSMMGLGGDDETPAPIVVLDSGDYRRIDPTPAGGVDLSPRSPSSGFSARVSATERFGPGAGEGRTVIGPAAAHFKVSDIPPNPLTDRLPKAARSELFHNMLYVEYDDQAAVVESGRPIDSLLLVQHGVVRVVNGPLLGDATDLARMSDGNLIGPFEFLSRAPSRGSMQAEGKLGMLELTREATDDLRKNDAQIGDALRSVLRETLLADLMDRAPIFTSLTQDQRRDLAGRFFTVEVEPGEPILQEGEINRRLFVLQSGELVVDGRGAKGSRMGLGPGDFFGFVSTLLGRPVQVAVVARTASALLVLPEQEVYRLVAGNKGVARSARREAVERGDQPISVHGIGGIGGIVVRRPNDG